MSSNNNDSKAFELLKTKRGKDLIFYKNYFFTKHVNKVDKTIWRCQDRGCTARLVTPLDKIEIIELRNSHNHVLSEGDISQRYLLSSLKNLAENTTYSTQQVYSMATSEKKNL